MTSAFPSRSTRSVVRGGTSISVSLTRADPRAPRVGWTLELMSNLVIKTADELRDSDVEARAGARRAARETPVLRAVLRAFADSGGPVSAAAIAASLGSESQAVGETLATLSTRGPADPPGRQSQARYTDIFSSLLLAEKLFSADSRNKVLILMSDMIEDYPPYAFDKMPWTPTTTPKLLSELDAKRAIPDLRGVCVYVSGVSAPTADLANNIGRFWEAYFRKAGADLHPSRYAHVLLHWPPSTSCHQDFRAGGTPSWMAGPAAS